jgi:hypothetical protein
MSVSDLTSVFSRYFMVGFYFPAFFGLAALSLTLPAGWVPAAMRLHDVWGEANSSHFTHPLLVVAGLAIPVSLLLSGVGDALLGLYRSLPFLPGDRLAWWQRHRHGKLQDESFATSSQQRKRNEAALELVERFPQKQEDVLPNRFANAHRALAEYADNRWGLDYNLVRPLLARFYTDGETTLLDDARTQVAFAIDFSFVLFVVGAAGAARAVWAASAGDWTWLELLRLLPLVASYLVYRLLAIDAQVGFGRRMRAAVDLHRLEVFEGMGVRSFPTFSAEELVFGKTLSTYLAEGPSRDGHPDIGTKTGAAIPGRYHEGDG